jgi:hypothetical protein
VELASLLLLLAGAQEPPKKTAKVDQTVINQAVEKGATYLTDLVKSGLPGVSYNRDSELRYEEMVLYTLLHAGTAPHEPAFKKLVSHCETTPLTRTYRVAFLAMCLQAVNPSRNRERLMLCARYLVDQQCRNGQWGYGMNMAPAPAGTATPAGQSPASGAGKTSTTLEVKKTNPGMAAGDNSNTQYAILGLRACAAAGIAIDPAVFRASLDWWEKSQLPDGSWNYGAYGVVDPNQPGYGSMTAGAVGSIVILQQLLKQSARGHKGVKAGMEWLKKNYSIDQHPGYKGPDHFQFYYLYALERAGMLYGTETFGAHEWYAEGADWLLKAQGSGSWPGSDPAPDATIANTCFAILFLQRAVKPPKVASVVDEKK